MPSMKPIVCFAVMLAVAAALNDTDNDVDRKHGRHGGRGHHGRGGHHCHHHHHHHGLPFFKNLSETVQQQFIDIWRDEDMSRDEKKTKINQLAESVLTPEQLTEFQKSQAEHEQRRKQRQEEMDKMIATLSPTARAAAEQIRAIWRDNTTSDSWKVKKEKTEKIKATLNAADKAELEKVWAHHWGGRCGSFLSRLSFYDNLDQSIKDKFSAIFRNADLNWAEKKEKINQLAQSVFTPAQLSEFEKMKAEHEQRKKQRQAEMDAKIAKLSPNARAAAEKIRAIFHDDTLDWSEKRKQMQAIKKELSESEQTELESIRPHRFHWRGGDKSKSEEKDEKEEEPEQIVSAADI